MSFSWLFPRYHSHGHMVIPTSCFELFLSAQRRTLDGFAPSKQKSPEEADIFHP